MSYSKLVARIEKLEAKEIIDSDEIEKLEKLEEIIDPVGVTKLEKLEVRIKELEARIKELEAKETIDPDNVIKMLEVGGNTRVTLRGGREVILEGTPGEMLKRFNIKIER